MSYDRAIAQSAPAFDHARQAFLGGLVLLAKRDPDLARQEAEATRSAMEQLLWLEAVE